jgi:PAS domain S-box-containing protein
MIKEKKNKKYDITNSTENTISIDDVSISPADTNDIIAIVDSFGVIKWINISILFYTGVSHHFFKNKKLSTLLFREDIVLIKNIFKIIKSGNFERQEIQIRLKKTNGAEFWFETAILPFKDKNNEVIAFQLIFHDITDKLKAEERREIERTKVIKALIEGQEMERKRISMELHDGLGQRLAAIKIKLENSSRLDLVNTREAIADVKEEFRQIIDDIRMISSNVSPASLSHWGLTTALAELCVQFEKSTGISCEYSISGSFDNIAEQKAFCIYRIIQEGFANITKHSKATVAKLFLIEKEKNLLVLIEDNGVGIKLEQLSQMTGNGLSNIKQRVGLLGGSVNFGNIKNSGTIIFIRLPK